MSVPLTTKAKVVLESMEETKGPALLMGTSAPKEVETERGLVTETEDEENAEEE